MFTTSKFTLHTVNTSEKQGFAVLWDSRGKEGTEGGKKGKMTAFPVWYMPIYFSKERGKGKKDIAEELFQRAACCNCSHSSKLHSQEVTTIFIFLLCPPLLTDTTMATPFQ